MNEYAGFWERTGAFVLDYLLILGYLSGLTLFTLLFNVLSGEIPWLFADRIRSQIVAFLLVTLPVAVYFAIGESSVRQATWGKRRLTLKVADRDGGQIPFWRAFWRTALKFIPWEISHTLIWHMRFSPRADAAFVGYGFLLVYGLIGLNIASLLLTPQHQTLYDFLARTYVMRSRA